MKHSLWPNLEKVILMMKYLKMGNYVIPHYNLELPCQVEGINYRAEKLFRLYANGSMSYFGYASGTSPQASVIIDGLIPSQKFIDRAYMFLHDDIRDLIKERASNSKMPNVAQLILKFNDLEFITL